MDTDTVIELMRSAPRRYETARGPALPGGRPRHQGRPRAVPRGRARQARGPPGAGGPPEVGHPEPDGPFGWRCRVWYARVNPRTNGGRYRVELELPGEVYPAGGTHVYAWDGAGAFLDRRIGGCPPDDDPHWLLVARDAFWTTYPFDPDGISGLPLFLYALDLRVEGRPRKAGREAVRLVGAAVEEWDFDPEPLWWGADEYEVLVDVERGVILRCASRIGGEDFDALEVEEISYDEPLPEGIFTAPEPLPWR